MNINNNPRNITDHCVLKIHAHRRRVLLSRQFQAIRTIGGASLPTKYCPGLSNVLKVLVTGLGGIMETVSFS